VKRLALALVLATAGALALYASIVGIGALVGGWSAATLREQAAGLGLHLGVVLVRGLWPSVLVAAALLAAWRRLAGRPAAGAAGSRPDSRADAPAGRPDGGIGAPAGLGVVALAGLLAAALVTPTLLTLPTAPFPHVRLEGAAGWLGTVALLGAGAATALLLARRLVR
jgi:hypothetical protein